MTRPRQTPHLDDLEQVRDQLRAEIREARETLTDLRREIRDARELVPLLTDELFTAEVKKQVDELGAATAQAMEDASDRVIARFDRLADTLLGRDHTSRRRGRTSIPDLVARRGDEG
ncbi:hypothetical protein RVR_10590 [Actinacidiphila reveromycinica]|uniref:Phosphotransferase system enzyme I N-terminal domain-containing protein n=1 Tax=Actinacidiphila reveromycinica TaxID=659352 RepID=A0A7U3UXI9_9ACTN|nr:phosphoenolpyruvate-utilizing N-terminal domain-containing protein [Streptomyces sp. SN-593]BBB00591.1 hypothetical protein RVR_7725 [Streptomyces sp. SN-593]BBB00644.1 hypothetical protein RVR_10590 [Streptomyces sp. SN-593]